MKLINFIRQKSYERVIKTVRRHPVTFVPYILLTLILLAMPIAVRWLITSLFPTFFDNTIIFPLTILFAGVYYLSVTLFFYNFFVDFYLDLLVVTNDRLIDVEQMSLFARKVSELDLYQIENATSEVKGFFASLFNYGNVTVETAGQSNKIVFCNVAAPHELRRELLDLAEADRKYHNK